MNKKAILVVGGALLLAVLSLFAVRTVLRWFVLAKFRSHPDIVQILALEAARLDLSGAATGPFSPCNVGFATFELPPGMEVERETSANMRVFGLKVGDTNIIFFQPQMFDVEVQKKWLVAIAASRGDPLQVMQAMKENVNAVDLQVLSMQYRFKPLLTMALMSTRQFSGYVAGLTVKSLLGRSGVNEVLTFDTAQTAGIVEYRHAGGRSDVVMSLVKIDRSMAQRIIIGTDDGKEPISRELVNRLAATYAFADGITNRDDVVRMARAAGFAGK